MAVTRRSRELDDHRGVRGDRHDVADLRDRLRLGTHRPLPVQVQLMTEAMEIPHDDDPLAALLAEEEALASGAAEQPALDEPEVVLPDVEGADVENADIESPDVV